MQELIVLGAVVVASMVVVRRYLPHTLRRELWLALARLAHAVQLNRLAVWLEQDSTSRQSCGSSGGGGCSSCNACDGAISRAIPRANDKQLNHHSSEAHPTSRRVIPIHAQH